MLILLPRIMFKKLLFAGVCILTLSFSNAQTNLWSSIEYEDLRVSEDDITNFDMTVKNANYYQLDISSLASQLNPAPFKSDATTSNVVIEIPNHKGENESYEIFKVKTLSPQLAQNYPSIKSYMGKSSDSRDASILKITITPQGFYAMLFKPDVGQLFINPYDKNGDYYMTFLKSHAQDLNHPNCKFDGSLGLTSEAPIEPEDLTQALDVDDSTLRTYDVALACTGEYAEFHINQAGLESAPQNQQITAVLAAMTVTIDRVNMIYERDFGVTMQLIPNTDQLIFLDASTDPYTNNSGGAMLGQNQTEVDSTIGFNNYNIGHVFSTGGGGIAGLGVVCASNQKARGVTGLPNPVGDPFDVDFVAHEMGHQFGANHTFNNSCTGNRNNSTAFEPGSGNTIMAYAGICPPNVQNASDAHFHQISISEVFINLFNGSASSCGTFTGQTNTAPTITPLQDHTIPNGTAFYLDVDASDAENDAITYNWEQFDNDISTQPPSQTSTAGPNFRSLPSKSDSRRYFPDFNAVLNNNLAPTWEVIPTVARSMDFAVTVRDNNVQVGQSSRDLTSVNFASVGPFEVTSQNTTGINWSPGETQTITWNVAGTTANGINTNNVNILLSTDGGQNFDTVLASNTANDGSEDITVPSEQAPFCRILVEPVDNVYYAVNSTDFAIDTTVTTTCNNFANTTSVSIPDSNGQNEQGPAVFDDINIPNDYTNIDDINITLNVSHDNMSDLLFQLSNSDGDFINLWARNCSDENGFNLVFNDDGATLPDFGSNCANPLTGTFAPAGSNIDLATLFSSGTQGDWTLGFADFNNGDTGTLNSWEIEICTTNLSVEDNSLNDFAISPNPNNGIFNLTFEQPISDDSKISIYNLQGRLIESLDFKPNSPNRRVELQNQYQSGLYLIEISNENGKTIDKLIIK